MKHTPGPWVVGEYNATEDFNTIKTHTAVMQVTPGSNTGLLIAITGPAGEQRSEADARLMAAAPDMLKALDCFLTLWGHICAETAKIPLTMDTRAEMMSVAARAQQAIEKAQEVK